MFKRLNSEPTALQQEITRILAQMQEVPAHSDEYTRMVKNVEVLSKTDKYDNESKLSPDTVVTVGANLAGILMILQHENAHVIASKALSFVTKIKA